MRICMFTNTYLPHVGGVARSVKSFATDLKKKGHQVLIIAPVFPGYEPEDRDQADILRVPAVQQFSGSDFSVRIPIPFFMDERINAFDPQVVHSHHPYLLGDTALRIARRRELPLIFTHHTLYEAYVHHLNLTSETLQKFAATLPTHYANLCDRVIAPSGSIAELICRRGVETPVEIIPTGVDTGFFDSGNGGSFRKDYGIEPSDFVIGHLGRLASEKNLEYLAQAVSLALQNRPGTVFLLAGEGPESDKIKTIFKSRGMENRLIMTGNLTGPTLADAYHAMDLFVFSSLTETQGMVLTEAMAAGTPVVALDGPGVREVVVHQKNGLLLPCDIPAGRFSEVLLQTMAAPETITAWASHARTTAAGFSREASADHLERLYREMATLRQGTGNILHTSLEPWEFLLNGIQAEWDLLVQKARSLKETILEGSRLDSPAEKTDGQARD